jgi:K+-sensing histidine kinase KdpD
MLPSPTRKLMLAISSSSPRARLLIDATSRLAAHLQATWFVVHVRQPLMLHYRILASRHKMPEADLDYARKLGARVIVEYGDTVKTLVSFAKKMGVDYFVTGRSLRRRFTFIFQLPLTEQIQKKLPNAILIMV